MKVQKIAVKDKDGVVQMVELGGSGGKRVNGGELLKEFQIANESTHLKPRGEMMGWEDISGLVANTGLGPTEAEKEMFKAEDGSYTLKRIVYDVYISEGQAASSVGLVVKAIATDETSKVTIYDKNWKGIIKNGASQTVYAMHPKAMTYFLPFRDGMDDMKLAAQSTPVDYNAQQRVYFEMEREDGSAVDHYVLVLRIAGNYNNNVGLYDYRGVTSWLDRGEKFQDRVKAEGTAPTKGKTYPEYAIWVYPDWTDLSVCPPNGEVTLWSDEVQEKIDAGDTGDLTKDQIDTVTKYGAVDEWGHPYPMAFRVGVPCCEMLHIKILAENPLSVVGFDRENIPRITNWAEGGIDAYYDCATRYNMGENIQFYAGVRTQQQNMAAASENNCRGFIISVEVETPEIAEFMTGSGASITFPKGTGDRVYTISDGTDVKSSRIKGGEIFVVLRHCNATYEARVTIEGKTYAGQIVTGAYYGECTLDADGWTEVTEE